MPVTRKDAMEFAFHLGRHTRATPSQVQRLLRYGATLNRLATEQCNREWTERDEWKRERIQLHVTQLCDEIQLSRSRWSDCVTASNRIADLVCAMYHPRDAKARLTWPTATWAEIIATETGADIPAEDRKADKCIPVFSNDPRGCCLKIRVPDGFTNDWGKEGICCPA